MPRTRPTKSENERWDIIFCKMQMMGYSFEGWTPLHLPSYARKRQVYIPNWRDDILHVFGLVGLEPLNSTEGYALWRAFKRAHRRLHGTRTD